MRWLFWAVLWLLGFRKRPKRYVEIEVPQSITAKAI